MVIICLKTIYDSVLSVYSHCLIHCLILRCEVVTNKNTALVTFTII